MLKANEPTRLRKIDRINSLMSNLSVEPGVGFQVDGGLESLLDTRSSSPQALRRLGALCKY